MRPFMTVLLALTLVVSAFATDYTITSGYYYDPKIYQNDDTLLMTGGGGYSFTGEDYSFLDIRNTSPLAVLSGGIWSLIVTDYSQLSLSGGQIRRLDIGDHAAAIISGGQINQLASGYYPSTRAWINIICQTYNYNATTKILTGTWADSSAFNTQLIDIDGHVSTYSVMKFTIIPEPATLLLLGIGGLLFRRRK